MLNFETTNLGGVDFMKILQIRKKEIVKNDTRSCFFLSFYLFF